MGRSIAQEFVREGARVVCVDINEAALSKTVAALPSGTAFALACDIANSAAVADMARKAEAATGRIDILVNCAGILDDYAPVTETSEELWDRILGVNLKGMFLVTRAVLPGMVSRGQGAIINISSIAGLVAGGGGAAYTSSKHGVVGLTRQLAYDYGKKGIRANAVCPGAVETAMTEAILSSGDKAVMELVRSVPAGRHGQPEEIAKLVLFLASDDASFVHGAAMVIDGGWTVK